MFDGELEKVNLQGVLNVGGSAPPSGVGFVPWTWKDDDGRTHKFRMKTLNRLKPSCTGITGSLELW